MNSIYNQGLEKVAANSQPLTPINFLNRTADVYLKELLLSMVRKKSLIKNIVKMFDVWHRH